MEINGEVVWDFGETEADREYFRLLQTSPWSEENARRLAELQPLETACFTKWSALVKQQTENPDTISWQDISKAEERDASWWNEWACLDSKWRRKTVAGRAAAKHEWNEHKPVPFPGTVDY
jgi:hypothetical protein